MIGSRSDRALESAVLATLLDAPRGLTRRELASLLPGPYHLGSVEVDAFHALHLPLRALCQRGRVQLTSGHRYIATLEVP